MSFRTLHSVKWSLIITLALAIAACGPVPSPAPTETPEPEPTQEAAAPSDTEETSGFRTFVIDAEASSASYIVDEEFFGGALSKYNIAAGRQDTVGTTTAIDGSFDINPDDLNNPLGTATFRVDLSQLSSNQRLRDRWLRNDGPEFSRYPMAEFVATAIENAPESYAEGEEVQFQLVGDMTIREITKPVTFDVSVSLQNGVIEGTATADMKLTDYEIEPPDFANTLTVKDDFQVRVEFVANEQ